MPNLLRTAHASHYYSSKPNTLNPYPTTTTTTISSTLVRRGGDGSAIPVFYVIGAILGVLALIAALLVWAKKSHNKAYTKQKKRGQHGSWYREARREGARHGSNPRDNKPRDRVAEQHGSAKSRISDAEEGYGGYQPDDEYDMPPPSYRSYNSRPNVKFPGLRHGYEGYGGSIHGSHARSEQPSRYGGSGHGPYAGSEYSGRRGAPTASEYFSER